MPPRRSGRVAAAAEQRAGAFPQLPLPLVLQIFLALPADQRLRCAEVSRGWRATVALPALWARLDLSPASGVALPVSLALLRAAVARAGGALRAIDATGADVNAPDFCAALRLAGAVEVLHAPGPLTVADLTDFLVAAPRLCELHAAVDSSPADAVTVLEGHPPFAPLRLRELHVLAAKGALPPTLFAALADARLQPGLACLVLF